MTYRVAPLEKKPGLDCPRFGLSNHYQRGRGRKTSSYKNDHNFFPFLLIFNRTTALKRKCATASNEILRKAEHCLVGELAVVAVLREQAVSKRNAA